jgi:hypothetical protein
VCPPGAGRDPVRVALSSAPLRWAPRRGARQTDPVIGSTSGSVAPVGYRFPREVIAVAVRWYLRYGLSYRDVEELLAERGIEVDHVTVYRWVQTFTPAFIDAARPARHTTRNRWFVDETYVKVAGRWTYLYRAVDQHGGAGVDAPQRRCCPAGRPCASGTAGRRGRRSRCSGGGSQRAPTRWRGGFCRRRPAKDELAAGVVDEPQ